MHAHDTLHVGLSLFLCVFLPIVMDSALTLFEVIYRYNSSCFNQSEDE
jgi:hypothetical protein